MVVSLAELADAVIGAPAKLGATRLVCIDGPAGSGKTTLATRLARQLRPRVGEVVPVVHMDDLYEGWEEALAPAADRLDRHVLAPLRRRVAGRYQRYDWHAGSFAEWHDVPVRPALIVEGVGSAPRQLAAETALLVWVDAPAPVRLRRGIARDGERLRQRWQRWMAAEARFFAEHGTAERADLWVDGHPGAAHDAVTQVVIVRGWPLSAPG